MQTDRALRDFYDDLGHKCYREEVKGSGAFGVVYQCEYEDDRVIAVKQLSLRHHPPHQIPYIYQEIEILKACKDENIIEYLFHDVTRDYIYIGMEYCDLTTEAFVDQYFNGRMPEKLVLVWMQQMANAFYALHQKNIIHRDLKLENVLVQLTYEQKQELNCDNLEVAKDVKFKLADMGFSKMLQGDDDLTQTTCGTPGYQAPEISESPDISGVIEYGIQADLFSLGVCVYKLLFGTLPFKAQSPEQLIEQMKNQKIQLDVPGVEVSDLMKQLILSMLKYDASQRLKWSDFYKHPIFHQKDQHKGIEKMDLQDFKNQVRAEAYKGAEAKIKGTEEDQFNFVGAYGTQQITQQSTILVAQEDRESTPFYLKIINYRNKYVTLLQICQQLGDIITQVKDEELIAKITEERKFFFNIALSMFSELDVDKMRKNFLSIEYKGKGQQDSDPIYQYIRKVFDEDREHFKQSQIEVAKIVVFQQDFQSKRLLVDKNLEGKFEMKIQTVLKFLANNQILKEQVRQEDILHLEYYILQAKDVLQDPFSEQTKQKQMLKSAKSFTNEEVQTQVQEMRKSRKSKIQIVAD